MLKKQLNTDSMTNMKLNVRIVFILLMMIITIPAHIWAQENMFTIKGTILESGTSAPVKQAVVSVAFSNNTTSTDTNGYFSLNLSSPNEVLVITYPGFHPTETYTHGQSNITVYLVKEEFISNDDVFNSLNENKKLLKSVNAISVLKRPIFEKTASSSLSQSLNGRVAGLHVIEHSGMPGHNSWLNIRGLSSIFGRNQPLVYIDGMIHEIYFTNNELIEGHLMNPLDIVDVDDVVNISVHKTNDGSMGSAGSNGAINIYTEQNENTSASIIFKMYGGISFPFASQKMLDGTQFKTYFTDLLTGQGYSEANINQAFPWLNGDNTVDNYFKYNNNTDWQNEMTKPSGYQKYHIFIKGGDEVATYTISTGFLRQGAAYEGWRNARYNLRVNGKINITNKLFVIPNIKLSLSDSYLSNMGPTEERNPVLASLLNPPLMAAHEKSSIGATLYPFDDIGVFPASNPAVLIDFLGNTRNFQLLSSGKILYVFNPKWNMSTLVGTSVNNDRQGIFIPDKGVISVLAYEKNTPRDMVTEFRSVQNHTTVNYSNKINNHQLDFIGGFRVMKNIYKNNWAKDLNTPSDDVTSLGSGKELIYLRTNGGELTETNWISYFGDFNYAFQDKYYVKASMSFDGASVFNSQNRYNFYPSVSAAWRLSAEDFLVNNPVINDLKMRISASQTGNMFSNSYVMSKNLLEGARYQYYGVPTKTYITNEDLSVEKKSSVSTGFDLTIVKKAINIHVDYHYSMVNNLMISHTLPFYYGDKAYIDNGGKLNINGIEFAADGRFNIGAATLLLDATVTYQKSQINEFNFINADEKFITHEVPGGEYVAMEGNPINSFYGYVTDGIYNTNEEANGLIGPNGLAMGAGDVKFMDFDGDGKITDSDKKIIGNPNPDLFGALSAALKIYRFEFSTLFNYSVGNDVFNYVRYKTTSMDSYVNQSVDVLERWGTDNLDAALPKASIGDPNGNNVFSDRWIEDGSFLRLKQITLSYTTPNIFGLQKETRFYVTGTNLLTFTKYTGYDPETMYQNSPYFMGIDYGKLPIARSIIFGIQISL